MEFVENFSKVIAHILLQSFGSNALSDIINFLVFLFFAIFVWFLRPMLMRFSFVRRIWRHEEKYCGNYIQIIQANADRRYSLISIDYDEKMRKYILSGKQYDFLGHPAIDFKSDRVFVVEDIYKTIEFSWVGGEINTMKDKYEGFTKMVMNDAEDLDMLDGHGFFITFDQPPKRVNLQFVKMTKRRLSEFNMNWPKKGIENKNFIVSLHSALEEHPELQPVDASIKPLVI